MPGPPHARTPIKGASAQSRPRRACPLNVSISTALPALGSARPSAGLLGVFRVLGVTGFDGLLSTFRELWC